MSVTTRAPVRIDFAGGWSDVPLFANREGGVVVNAAITRGVRVDFLLGGKTIRLRAEDTGEHVTLPASTHVRYDGRLDLHKAALNMLPVTGGIEVLSNTDLPRGSGLGGSGALDVALLAGLARCRGEMYEPAELAELGFMLETMELGMAGGRQDQYAAALGGMNEMTFGEDRVDVRPLVVTAEMAADLEAHTVLVYTGQSHFSSDTHNRVWGAYTGGDAAVTDALRAIRDVATDAAKTIERADWRGLAKALDENWRQQQRLDAAMSTPVTGKVEAAARDAGAWGLKATGAGAGGCFVVLTDPATRDAVASAVTRAGASTLDFRFAFQGVETVETGDDDD